MPSNRSRFLGQAAIVAGGVARRHGLELAARSGGHSHLAWGSSGGLVIDLAALRRIAVDPARRIVMVDGGVLGGDVAVAAGRLGLAPVLGRCPGVPACAPPA